MEYGLKNVINGCPIRKETHPKHSKNLKCAVSKEQKQQCNHIQSALLRNKCVRYVTVQSCHMKG
jgi:hypothetical protein